MSSETRLHSQETEGSPNEQPLRSESSADDRISRLRQAVRNAGGNTQVAARSGIPFSTLSSHLAGRDMRLSTAIAIARACNVSLEWLAEGVGEAGSGGEVKLFPMLEMRSQAQTMVMLPPNDDSIEVKFFHKEPSAKHSYVPDEWEGSEVYTVSKAFINQIFGAWHENLFFVRIQGDTMQPSLNPGDTILVDCTTEPMVNGVFVMALQGMLMIKRISIKTMDTFTIDSDNPRYSSFEVPMKRACWGNADMDADLRIIGRVVGRFQHSV